MMSSVLLAACLSAAQPSPAALVAARQLGDPSARVQLDRHGLLRSAQGQLGFLGPRPEHLSAFLHQALPLELRADEDVRAISDELDALGTRHIRAQRLLHGMPVAFDQVRLHANAAGLVYAMESELSPLSDFVYRAPRLTPLQAEKIAEGGFKGKLLEPTRSELVILGENLEGIHGTHVAYKVHVSFPARPGQVPVIEDEYVDAHTGQVLAHLSRVYTEGTPGQMAVPDLYGNQVNVNVDVFPDGVALKDIDTPNQGGPTIYTFDNANNGSLYTATDTNQPYFPDGQSQNGEAGSVASNVKTAVDFYSNQFGWNRWDFSSTPAGQGGLLAGIAHEGQNLANAFFVPQTAGGKVFGTMHYGDGDGTYLTNTAKCLDVSGHELGHGVVAGTADLAYHNQSGALNEHFADVFGWMLKNQNGQQNDYIGDQCVGPQLAPALRDMCHPDQVTDAQPADMAHYQSLPDTSNGDHGGVHTNSGIPNHAACLFRNAENGFGKLGAIWFTALRNHLGATSSFQDMVTATGTACTELIGTTTSQQDCDNLVNAWAGVGLATAVSGSTGSCPDNSTAQGSGCVCNDGFQPDASGNCVAIPPQQCPEHATFDPGSGSCYCDQGYQVSADGQSCELEAQGGCGANSHAEAGTCVCDTCYVYTAPNPGEETGTCQQDPNCNPSCDDPGSTNDAQCSCLPGLSKDANGKCTVPAGGGCGNENFAGRCEGNTLVYCYTGAAGNPNGDQVIVYDCAAQGLACGPDTQAGGFNCVQPTSNCGSVTVTGACNGNQGSYCSDGVLESFDCGGSGCIEFKYAYQGTTYTYDFCNPCDPGQAPDPSGTPNPDGSVHCVAQAGGSSGTNGTSGTGGSSGTTGDAGSGGSAGGCGAAGNGTSMFLFAAVLGLALVRRKR